MFYLGIDIGKNTHVASLIDDKKKVIFKALSFSNSIDGAESLILKLKSFKNELEVGMEATGHYWLSIYSYLVEKNFTVRVINPIQTDGWRQGVEIRKRKTDIIDSLLIADLLRYGDFIETSLSNEVYLSLRNLSRFRSYLVSSISAVNSATILSEIGDIKRFSNPSKLVVYAGIDSSISQSGEFESTSNHMTKRGSPYLRRAMLMRSLYHLQVLLKKLQSKKQKRFNSNLCLI